MRKLMLPLLAIIISIQTSAQDKQILIKYFLQQIAAIQIKEGNDQGLFPSFREHNLRRGIEKFDDNVFMTGLIVWTIRKNLPVMNKENQALAIRIMETSMPVYTRFQNAKGRSTYNYWKTKPPVIFPNAGLINLLDKAQALPDDMDCSSITMMAIDAHRDTVVKLHEFMQGFTNDHGQSKTMLPFYNRFKTYSTWFGRKMPVDMDVCVLSNVLTLVNSYDLPFTIADQASLDFIRTVVERRDYLKNADLIAGHYQKPSIILYHLSRLMAVKNIPALETFRAQLVADALALYRTSPDLMEKIILSTSLKRWGAIVPEITMRPDRSFKEMIDQSRFAFFIANMAVIIGHPYNRILSRSGLVKSNYYCTALNYALLLENVAITTP